MIHFLASWSSSRRYSESALSVHAVAFNSAGNVAIVFTTYERTNDRPLPGTGLVHFACFDTKTGKVTFVKQWPAQGSLPIIAPTLRATYKGNFLLKNADQLVLYSPALEEITSVELGAGRYLPNYYWVSTDGHYVFLESEHDKVYTLSMLDAETLKTIRSWTLEQPFASASERYLAMWREFKEPARSSLYLRSDSAQWKELYVDQNCNNRDQYAHFVTENVLLILSCNKMVVMNVEGKVLASHALASNTPVEVLFDRFDAHFASYVDPGEISVSPSSGGQRFAIVEDEIKRDPWWTGDPGRGLVPWRLVIYETKSGEASFSFAFNVKYPSSTRSISFALSPDGSELALFRDGVLAFFRLPAPKS
jgi:hypothetical protein